MSDTGSRQPRITLIPAPSDTGKQLALKLAEAAQSGKQPQPPRKRWPWAARIALTLFILLCLQCSLIFAAQWISVTLTPTIAFGPNGQAIAGAQALNLPTPHPVSTERDFLQLLLPYARVAHDQTGWPVSVILAQWGQEHGWQLPDFDGWNLGNEKAYGNQPITPSGFCIAANPEIGLAQYLHVAALPYYDAIAPAARLAGADAAARALGASPWDAGHYTHDNNPGDDLLHLMRVFNLYQYD